MTPDDRDLIQRRQRARAIVLALLLGAFVVLIFFITIAKIRQGEGQRMSTTASRVQTVR